MTTRIVEISCEERLPDILANTVMTTKLELLEDIKKRKKDILSSIKRSTIHTTSYYMALEELFDRFISQINKTVLPKRLEDWWRYSYEVSPFGAVLFLEHTGSVDISEPEMVWNGEITDQIFVLVSVRSEWLTVEDYAKMYRVEPVTVRQWIRRGKLKSAVKNGKEWMIPELVDVPGRGYEPGQYKWRVPLLDVPDEFAYLREYRLITLWQDDQDKNTFHAKLTDMNGYKSNTKQLALTAEERERLELYLISSAYVDYVSDTKSFRAKKQVEEEDE